MSNFRYSDSFPYSAEHVTYSGVPTTGVSGLRVSVTVLRKNTISLVSRLTILREAPRDGFCRVLVRQLSSVSLSIRLYVYIFKDSATSNIGKYPPIRARRVKVHRLVSVCGFLEIRGAIFLRCQGFIWAFGNIVKYLGNSVVIDGNVVKNSSGQIVVLADRLDRLEGGISLGGKSILGKSGSLVCCGITVNSVSDGIMMSGQKDLMPVLVALDMLGLNIKV